MEEGIMPIKSLQARCRRETFQTLSYVELFMTTIKIISAMDASIKCKKARMEEGIMSIKSLQARWRRETFQRKYPMWKCSSKMKNNFGNGYQYEMQKSRDGGGNNAYKIFASWLEEGKIPNTISYVELFVTAMKMKNSFCNGRQYEMQKSWDGGGNNACKIFMCHVEEENIIYKQNILFGAVHIAAMKKKQFYGLSKK